jgi:hypothetical protein
MLPEVFPRRMLVTDRAPYGISTMTRSPLSTTAALVQPQTWIIAKAISGASRLSIHDFRCSPASSTQRACLVGAEGVGGGVRCREAGGGAG